jgi:hypothetical protein
MKRRLQSSSSSSQQAQGDTHGAGSRDQFAGPWFNTDRAARYLDKPTAEAFRKWAYRAGIAFSYCGGRILVAKADLDRAIASADERRRSA